MSVLPAGLATALLDSWAYFLHLAFVVGGAGVSLPNLALLNGLFDRRLLVVYAGTVVAIGTGIGVLFDAVLV